MSAEPAAKRPRAKKTTSSSPSASETKAPNPESSSADSKQRPEIVSIRPSISKKKTDLEEKVSSPESTPRAVSPAENITIGNRLHPIPPPSERMQYRAIGLVLGRYQPISEEEFNRGKLITPDGTEIDAVLLGQVMNLMKKYLDLNEEYLWVVYPRTRDEKPNTFLHLQIVGVWEPDLLQQSPPKQPQSLDHPVDTKDGYFSIRGEIVFYAQDQTFVVVKIQQAPRRRNDKPRSFKIKVYGSLEMKSPGFFWDLQVQREEGRLVITEAHTVGVLPPRKVKSSKRPARPSSGRPTRPGGGSPRPAPAGERRAMPTRPVRRSLPNPPSS
ncbi:hypothetical protein L3556_05080 [Candidatus Synechococcus calcipolaris G9]|uniref:Uncharacterized protein n=1 Tax=Candidatus Synechococcus calcipolaris G9 TaxID=1497997 RepID=A0ABT6EX12_9SYNE|nr:hypothetical protein [Candidatus Synechococcus calcipolaris]MDG2990311.1 hypothetical protein [Candidatus Synechococcus calcipolaris G9]